MKKSNKFVETVFTFIIVCFLHYIFASSRKLPKRLEITVGCCIIYKINVCKFCQGLNLQLVVWNSNSQRWPEVDLK